MKPGYKTTEFYLSLAVLVVGVILASGYFEIGGSVERVLSFVAAAMSTLGYTGARALGKYQAGAAAPVAEMAQ